MNATENICPFCGKAVQTTALQGICPECMLQAGAAAETGEVGPDGTVVAKTPSQPAPKVAEIAPHFPQLEILECLGRGGMGAVYKARQPKLERLVALKILTRPRDSGIADADFAARFQQEARALARLNHPDIVAVYDFGEAGGFHYLLMEYVDGLTLRQLLQTRKIAPEEALAIVPKICEALQFAHERGIVHRDIKPENILLDQQGRVKIADFGIAKILGAKAAGGSLTGVKDVMGTPHYMAPEQIERPANVDHRADIYSLGVVFYEMLTGELPLGNFQRPSRKVQVDVRLDEVVLHALEKEPDRRYQHASEVKTDVETIAVSPCLGSGVATSNASAQAVFPVPGTPAKLGDSFLGYSVVWLATGLECGLIVSGLLLVSPLLLVLAAASSAVWGVTSAICIVRALEKRGMPVNFLLLRLLIFKYVSQYRAAMIKETGKAGPLFYSYVVAMNLALIATVLACATGYRTNVAELLSGPAFSRSGHPARDSTVLREQLVAASFGPVIERELCFSLVTDRSDRFLDLDSDQFVTPPPEVGQYFAKGAWIGWYSGVESKEAGDAMQAWVRTSGADLLADGWQKRLSLLGGWAFDQDTRDADLVEFDRADPAKTLQRLAKLDEAMRENRGLETRLSFLHPPGWYSTGREGDRGGKRVEPHDTCLFRTAAGSFGMLQFGEFRENPPRVSIRYKLVAGRGASPAVSASTLASFASVPPVVIATVPQSGAEGVDPALTELRVTFSEPMQEHSGSISKWGEAEFPELAGELKHLEDQRTWVFPVQLRPGRVYALWLNSEHERGFQDQSGQSAVPYLLIFETRK